MSDAVDLLRPPSQDAPGGPAPAPPPGPLLQSVVIGFRVVYAAIAVMALVWLVTNISQISPDSQAVVMRFGRIDRAQSSGLLFALPRPIEEVRLLPGPARQLSQKVTQLPPSGGLTTFSDDPSAGDETSRAAPFLTGDGNIVFLNATLIFRINDAKAYVLSEKHVAPALDRLFRSAAVRVAAGHNLNDFLVSRSGGDAGSAPALRTAVLDELVTGMNTRLDQLAKSGAGLGVEVQRIDMTALLPPDAKTAFDAVLTATQAADQDIAAARTEAEQKRQAADRERDSLIAAANATASEMVSNANVRTAAILALAKEASGSTHDSVLWRAYREEVAKVMQKVGSVTVVDPANGARLILPGRQ